MSACAEKPGRVTVETISGVKIRIELPLEGLKNQGATFCAALDLIIEREIALATAPTLGR